MNKDFEKTGLCWNCGKPMWVCVENVDKSPVMSFCSVDCGLNYFKVKK